MIVHTSAMKACFDIAECRLSSAKIVQTSAMKACFDIAECRLSSAKIVIKNNKHNKSTWKGSVLKAENIVFHELFSWKEIFIVMKKNIFYRENKYFRSWT